MLLQCFIWFLCFSYLCTKNLELLTSSHSRMSNTHSSSFRRHLNTFFVQSAYRAPPPIASIPNAHSLSWPKLWCYTKHLTYSQSLLSYIESELRLSVLCLSCSLLSQVSAPWFLTVKWLNCFALFTLYWMYVCNVCKPRPRHYAPPMHLSRHNYLLVNPN